MSQILLAQNFLYLNGVWSWFYWALSTYNKQNPVTLKDLQNKFNFILYLYKNQNGISGWFLHYAGGMSLFQLNEKRKEKH